MNMNNNNQTKRYIYYWTSFLVGYVFPFVYFTVKVGITKTSTSIVLPTVLTLVFLVVKLTTDIKEWTSTWKPSFKKGMVQAIPKLLLFILLISLGLTLQVILKRQVEIMMSSYFEAVLVIFGAQALSEIIRAMHLKYKEMDLIEKGYVLGVVNR